MAGGPGGLSAPTEAHLAGGASQQAARLRRSRVWTRGLLTIALIVDPVRGIAQVVRVPGAPVVDPARPIAAPSALPARELTLAEAIRVTLQHSPVIARARQDLALSLGRLQETRGAFDPVVRVAPGGAYLQQELTPALRGLERNKRDQLTILFGAFDGLNRGIREQLESLQARAPYCPPDLAFADGPDPFFTDRRDPLENRVVGFDRDFRQDLPIRIDQGIIRTSIGAIRLGDICRPTSDTGLGSEEVLDLWRRLNQTGRYRLDALIDGLRALPEELGRFRFELTETLASRTQLALERLGPLPRDDIRKQIFVEAGISKPLRNGLTLSLDSRFESEERNFRDKPLDPAFGGFAIQGRFPSFASATAEIPLRRGLGRTTVGAPERAAELTLRAQRRQIRHRISEEVFRAVLAYVNLQARQEAVRVLEASADRQQQLAELTQNLLDVGEVARADLDRTRARVATIRAALADRQLDLLTARGSLAQVMGILVDDLYSGPVAIEAVASTPIPDLPATGALMTLPRAQRADAQALQFLEEASRVLAAAATSDLKPRLDLALTGGMSTLYESPFARYLPDEVNPIFSQITPPATPPGRSIRYYSARGFGRSLTGEWKPFVKALINFELPFGNRAARGRLAQARASQQQSGIERLDLDRRIQDNVSEVSGVIRALDGVIERRRVTLDRLQEAYDASVEQFRIGEITLLDTLVTEESLTQERVQLAEDVQLYASALARLKFETGTLVAFDALDTPSESIAVLPLERLRP